MITSLSHSHHTPFLPRELERDIMELTALAFPEMRIPLQLVARRVRYWVEPILYNALMFSEDLNPQVQHALELFMNQMERKDPYFLHRHVHALFVEQDSSPTAVTPGAIVKLLKAFTGLRYLLLGVFYDTPTEVFQLITQRPLKHMILGDSHLLNHFLSYSRAEPQAVINTTLTHTHFADINDIKESFDHLVALTHLSLSAEDFLLDPPGTLSCFMNEVLHLPSLKLCQILLDPDEQEDQEKVEKFLEEHKIDDERVVIVDFHGLPDDYDWQDFFLYNGLWEQGERILEDRRRKRIAEAEKVGKPTSLPPQTA